MEHTEALARQAMDLAETNGEKFHIMVSQCFMAYVRHQRGAAQEAWELLSQAEDLQKEFQPQWSYLYSLRGFHFCDLILDREGYSGGTHQG